MKVFIIACLAVAALAESDPNLILTNGMYHGLPLTTSYINTAISPISYIQPTVQLKSVEMEGEKVMEKKVEVEEKKPIVYSALPTFYNQHIIPQVVSPVVQKVVVPPRYVAKNGEVEHIVAKREADPYMIYSGLSTVGYPWRSVYSGLVPSVLATNKATFINPFTGDVTGKVTNDAITTAQYAGKGSHFVRAPGTNTVHIAKREADPLTIYSNIASPIVSPLVKPITYATNPVFYNSFVKSAVASPVVYNSAVASPVVYNSAVVSPVVYNKALGVEGVQDGKTVADDAWQMTPMYAGKGLYDARTPGSRHVAKRDAEPWTTLVRPYSSYNLGLRTVGYPYANLASPYYNSYVRYF